MSEFEIVVVGSCMVDFVSYASGLLPLPGETVFGTAFEKNYGGKGANQAVQCGRLGLEVVMIGVVGCDEFGSDYVKQFTAESVNASCVDRSISLTTGIASISVDSTGQNSIIIVPGANLDFSESKIQAMEKYISKSKILVCQNEVSFNATLSALQFAKQHGTVSILNPAPVTSTTKELLPFCDILCPNETELSVLSGSLPTTTDDEIHAAARHVLDNSHGGCSVVVVTMGSRGACIVRKQDASCEFVAANKVAAVDTVGAGDSFIGSLASNLARGASLSESVRRAVHCASISVTRKGAQKSYPFVNELEESFRPPAQSVASAVNKDSIRSNLEL